ncbi:MAG: futalosine hydrolase [Saprospiraceae bacterium]
MQILILAATNQEIQPFIDFLEKSGKKNNFFSYHFSGHDCFPVVTGVGATMTAFGIARVSNIKSIQLAIQIGIAGSYDFDLKLGDTVRVEKDRFADLAIEYPDEKFKDIYQENLTDGNYYPFQNQGWIHEHKTEHIITTFPYVPSITVNTTSGSTKTIQRNHVNYNPTLETMEGAGCFYACKMLDVPVLQLRSISNYVIPRDKSTWNIPLALGNLTDALVQTIQNLG